jgi:hypothetical protein
MGRELGLNPKKFGSLANTKQEPWKLPLPEYIEELYFKHFKKSRPDSVRSIEQVVRDYRKKKQEHRMRRVEERDADPFGDGEDRQQCLCAPYSHDRLISRSQGGTTQSYSRLGGSK